MPGDRFIELALDKGRHVLDVLFFHAAEAVTIQDQSGGLVYANDQAARALGATTGKKLVDRRAETFLTPFDLVDIEGRPVDPEELPGRRVLRGESVAEQVVGYRHRETGEIRWSRVRSSPIKDDEGNTIWVLNFFSDITEDVVRERESELLARVRDALSATLEVEELLVGFARVIVPRLASWGAVHLIDDDGFLTPVATVQPGSTTDQIVTEHRARIRIPVDAVGLQPRVVRSGLTEMVRFGSGSSPGEELPILADAIRRFELSHVVCAPLKAGERVVGTFTLGRRAQDDPFTVSERRWVDAVSERAGTALANALLYAHERETAEVLQRGLVPTELPAVEGFQVASRYQPQAQFSGVGGDFYDLIPIDEKLCVVAVGDIEGKGIPAAAAVGVARHTFRATVALDPDPRTVIKRMNEVLRTEEPSRMCTLAYVRLQPSGSGGFSVGVSLAGHPPPMVIRVDGTVEEMGSPFPPLGFLTDLDPHERRTQVDPGDTILLYTDGFALDNQAPPESLAPLLEGAQDEDLESLLDRLMARLRAEQPNPRDDVVLLALRVMDTGQ